MDDPTDGGERGAPSPTPTVSSAPQTSQWPTLRQGDFGPRVRVGQYLLQNHGSPVAVDGVFSTDTVDAVLALQTNHGIPNTGELDPTTWESISPDLRRRTADPSGPTTTTNPIKALQTLPNVYGAKLAVDGVVRATTWQVLLNGSP
ncbi:MAG: peptidoglycan-binding domain-containing protein [Pseudonocardiales bacterium]